ncbi:MAG: ABC transporter substrate-binding protein [Planctomycetota bacterium]
MKDNAIVSFFKLCGTLLLAFLVWLTYFQSSNREEIELSTKGKVDQMQADMQALRTAIREQSASTERLAGQVEALKDVLASGALVARAPTAAPSGSGDQATAPPRVPRAQRPPSYLGAEAVALWGRHPDFLVPDPDPIPTAAPDTPGADPNGELKLFWGAQPSKLNPLTASDSMVTTRIVQYCLSSIAAPHAKDASTYTGDVAVRVEVNVPDYTEYVVFLRDDVYWHTPAIDLDAYSWLRGRHKLTAHDIKFTLDMITNPDVDCEHLRGYYTEYKDCTVIDDHCCIIRWKKPQYNSISFTLSMSIIPEFILAYNEVGERYEAAQIGVAFNDHWLYRDFKYVGSGPYRVTELNPDSHIKLERNDEFYGERPAIRVMRMLFNNDNQAGMRLVETRDVDAEAFQAKVWHRRAEEEKDVPSIFTDGSLGHVWVQGTGFAFIGWKNTHPIFEDKRVRKAMTLACDRPRFLRNLFMGQGTIASGTQPVDSPFTPPDLEPLPFDLEAAKAELAAAGWADTDGDGILDKELRGVRTPFKFVATVPSGVDTWLTLFTIFKEDLSKIGVQMTLEFLDWKIFVNKLDTREFECVTLSWQHSGWESDPYQIWHSSQADVSPSSNFIEYRNQEVDGLIEKLRETFELEERLKMQHRIQRIFHDEQPYTFLISAKSPYVWWKDTLGGVEEATQFLLRPRVRFTPMWVKAKAR